MEDQVQVNKIAFTGLDDNSDIVKAMDVVKYSSVPIEYGILIRGNKPPKPRYPSPDTITEILNKSSELIFESSDNRINYGVKTYLPNIAIHVCGEAKDMIKNGVDPLSHYLINDRKLSEEEKSVLDSTLSLTVDRIQINSMNLAHDFDIDTADEGVLLSTADNLLGKLSSVFWYCRDFIFQYSEMNQNILELITNPDSPVWDHCGRRLNCHILYDCSGGRGIEIERGITEIQTSHNGSLIMSGVAGGIGPENIIRICDRLEGNSLGKSIYLDMESGIRTNDELDINKIRLILYYIEQRYFIKDEQRL